MVREKLSRCFDHVISSLQAVLRAWPDAKWSSRDESFPLRALRPFCPTPLSLEGPVCRFEQRWLQWAGPWLGAGPWAGGRPPGQRGVRADTGEVKALRGCAQWAQAAAGRDGCVCVSERSTPAGGGTGRCERQHFLHVAEVANLQSVGCLDTIGKGCQCCFFFF